MPLYHNHPSITCYEKHGCRCGECRHLGRVKRMNRKLGIHKHPSLNCYKKHGCRCAECTRLNTEATLDKRRQRRTQIPNVLPEWEVELLRRAVGYHEDVS